MKLKTLITTATIMMSTQALAETYLHIVVPMKFEDSRNQYFKTQQKDFILCLQALKSLRASESGSVIAWCGENGSMRY